jgi:hypothetical protein
MYDRPQQSVFGSPASSVHPGILAIIVRAANTASILAAAILLGLAGVGRAQTFTSTSPMNASRYAHTATLLDDGTVLTAGGCMAESNCLATAQIYNPANGTFSSTGSMFSKRWAHTATLLNNGSVLITGGCTGGGTCVNTAEIYNPLTGSFNVTGSMSVARYMHSATRLNDGTVLITGGCQSSGNCNATAEIYNPLSGMFTTVGSMSSKRYSHGAILLNNGKVLVTGGCTGGGTCLTTADLYDPVVRSFTPTGTMSVARYMHSATLLGDGTVLIAGGCSGNGTCRSTAELYNPATGTFSITGSMTVTRYDHAATPLFDGTILLSGGCQSSGNCNATAEIYHPITKTFSATGSMTSKRWDQAATLLINGTVLTSGGCTGGGTCVSSADLYHGPAPVLGMLNPKYLVLGIAYAPPGSHSNVDYGTSTMFGTSTDISSSFAKTNTSSISYGFTSGSIFGIFGNEPDITTTTTFTKTFTQEQDSSSSISLNKTSSFDNVIPGPASDYVGVDHDFDLIYIWLNPIQLFGLTTSNPTNIQFMGYRFDLNDPVSFSGELDVVVLQVAQLKNPALIDQGTLNQLARTWAPSLADGSGPGLTSTDLLAIAAADPFSDPTYQITITPTSFPCSTDGRFCAVQSVVSDVPYTQPAPGGQPTTTKFSQAYESIAKQGQGSKDTHTTGISFDANLTNGFLSLFNMNIKLTTSEMLTMTNSFSQTTTNTTNQSVNVSVTGPACVVPTGSTTCNPAYTGATAFNVFEDTIYRAFMFNPAN